MLIKNGDIVYCKCGNRMIVKLTALEKIFICKRCGRKLFENNLTGETMVQGDIKYERR